VVVGTRHAAALRTRRRLCLEHREPDTHHSLFPTYTYSSLGILTFIQNFMMRMYTPNPQDLDSLLHSFHETKNQERALRLSIKAAIEERVIVARAQIEKAEKSMKEAQRILHEVFGETEEKNHSVPSPVAHLEASTWKWFDKEVYGTTAVGIADDSVPLSPVAGSVTQEVHDVEETAKFVSGLLFDMNTC
jgi:hypothetical protein